MPKTSAAVCRWMSIPSRKALRRIGSSEKWASSLQFHLGVIRPQEDVARVRDEGLAHLPPQFAPHRDVLQIWVPAGEATRGRHRLHEGGVNPAGGGVDQFQEGVHVSRLELAHGAVFQDLGRQRVGRGQGLEHLHVGGQGLALGLLLGGEVKLFKENPAQLLRRIDQKLLSGQVVNFPLQALHGGFQVLAEAPEIILVQADAQGLHAGQNGQQGQFQAGVKLP